MKYILFLLLFFSLSELTAQDANDYFNYAENANSDELKIIYYTKAIELGYKPVERAYNNRGVSKENLKLFQDSMDDFSMCIILTGNSHIYSHIFYCNRGVSKMNLKMYLEAIKDFDKSIMLNPNYSKTYNRRGSSKYFLGLFEDAIQDHTKAINIEPTNPSYYNDRGYNYLKVKNYKGSINDWDKMIALMDGKYMPNINYIDEVNKELEKNKKIELDFSPFMGETNNSVNLRNEPNVSSVVAKQLYKSNKLYVFSNNDSNGFLKVIDIETGTIGWVSKNYVTYVKKLDINRNDVFQKTGNSNNYNPEVEVKNTSSYKITLIVDQEVYTINPYSSISISVSPKSYNYVASASGVIPISGVQNFANNSKYSWVFSVVRR